MLFGAGFEKNGKHAAGAAAGAFGLARFVDAQPARGSDGRRVHQVRLLRQCLVQDRFDGGVADKLRLPFRNVSAVAQQNLFQRALTSLRQERAQALRQHDVRLQLEIFIVRH